MMHMIKNVHDVHVHFLIVNVLLINNNDNI